MDKQLNALISVFNKDGIEEVAKRLVLLGYNILSSGGTASYLSQRGIAVQDVAGIVGKPILNHKVVTLSREVHAGLLSDFESEKEMNEMATEKIGLIHLVICGLYPLEQAIKDGLPRAKVIEKTDMGGAALISSAAKGGRPVICDPNDYEGVLTWLEEGMPDKEEFLMANQAKADLVVSMYRMLSAEYHSKNRFFGVFYRLFKKLRYGENPHQKNAMHLIPVKKIDDALAIHKFEQLEGAEPSMVNKTDFTAAINVLNMAALTLMKNKCWTQHTKIAVVVKHGTPCGFGHHPSSKVEALQNMIAGDPQAAFGGAVVTNFPLNEIEAELLKTYKLEPGEKRIYDLIAVPKISDDAITTLARKDDKCRIYENNSLFLVHKLPLPTEPVIKQIRGGIAVCDAPQIILDLSNKLVSFSRPDTMNQTETIDLCIAHAICAQSKSNTITYVKNGVLLANASGQQSRVQCVRLANMKLEQFHPEVTGFVAASDSFFPATDGPLAMIEAGAKTVFTTTGSRKDGEVMQMFGKNSVNVVSMKDADGRLFFGH